MVYGVVLVALLCGATSVDAMFTSKSSVIEVSTQNKFESLVLDSDGVTMVKFYAECTVHTLTVANDD